MRAIPSFLTRKLYVAGSLCNTPAGSQFTVRNLIGSGTVCQIYGVQLGANAYPLERIGVLLPGRPEQPATATTADAPLWLGEGVRATLRLNGLTLESGRHTIQVRVQTIELGDLEIGFSDFAREFQEDDMEPVAEEDSGHPEATPDVARVPIVARPIKVAILGAGSAVFARQLMADLLCTPGLERGTFALVDIDARRLELAQQIGERLVAASGRPWSVQASTDRTQLLPGSDYVLNTIEVAGLRNVRPDYDIPLKYGVDQCIGDTIGPGGIFKMLRTGPDWLDIVHDVERLCPRAVVMNYTNPMSALTLLALRATSLDVVGLCHSVQGTSRQVAAYLGLEPSELDFRCAGINHMAWFTELTHDGEDMYHRLHQAALNPEIYEADPIRFEIMRHFGAFVTESSGHFSEYVPYFRKRPDLLARYARPGYRGESGFYANNWPHWRAQADETIAAQLTGKSELALQRSQEYASTIVEAIETGRPTVIYGNVRNDRLIENLPSGGCVEVSVRVDGMGLHPLPFGALPPQLAALNAAHMAVHELMVKAVLERDRQAALHALMLDPLTAAVCSLEEIGRMFDEMWESEKQDLARYIG